jgi:hypothetical protein
MAGANDIFLVSYEMCHLRQPCTLLVAPFGIPVTMLYNDVVRRGLAYCINRRCPDQEL